MNKATKKTIQEPSQEQGRPQLSEIMYFNLGRAYPAHKLPQQYLEALELFINGLGDSIDTELDFEEFIYTCLAKGYYYQNFASAYLLWTKKHSIQDTERNE